MHYSSVSGNTVTEYSSRSILNFIFKKSLLHFKFLYRESHIGRIQSTDNVWLQSSFQRPSENIVKLRFPWILIPFQFFQFHYAHKPYSLIRLLAFLLSYSRKELMIALGQSKSHRVAQLLTLLSQPLTYKSCSDSCPCVGRGLNEGMHSAHSPADINSSQSSHSI